MSSEYNLKLPCKPPLRQCASHLFCALDLHQHQAENEPYPNGLILKKEHKFKNCISKELSIILIYKY